jgi:hypothetical protein
MDLRTKLREEFAAMQAEIDAREKKFLPVMPKGYRGESSAAQFGYILHDLFDDIYAGPQGVTSSYSQKKDYFEKVIGKLFGISLPETADLIYSPDNKCEIHLRSVRVEKDDVVVTIGQWVSHIAEVTTEPKMAWVLLDDKTKIKRPVLDDKGQPIVKTIKHEAKNELLDLTYRFPLSLFVNLLNEIGRDSLIKKELPDGYIPEVASNPLSEILNSMHPYMGPMIFHGSPSFPGTRYNPIRPFRLFLAPEPNTGRYEVQIEYYSEEETAKLEEEHYKKSLWAKWDLRKTEAYQGYLKSLWAKLETTA